MTGTQLFLGSTGCQPVVFGSLPKTSSASLCQTLSLPKCCRQAAGNCRLAACAPQNFELRHSFVLRHSDFVILVILIMLIILIMPADSKIIEVAGLVRKFGDRAVLNDISFDVDRGETLVIMGGSGC